MKVSSPNQLPRPMSLLLNAEKEESFSRPDSFATYDLDRALVEAAEEMEIDWPESIPVERIKAGITEIALGFLLFAGLVAFCAFYGFGIDLFPSCTSVPSPKSLGFQRFQSRGANWANSLSKRGSLRMGSQVGSLKRALLSR
jgi:hypothetical protein